MNNDAFRALINKQRASTAGEKSTKEIAREVVENEFQKKRRRGGGSRRGRGFNAGQDDSDSGYSCDENRGVEGDKDATQQNETNDDDRDWKRRRREKRLQDGSGRSGAGVTLEYRDRAKERREGNNIDYALMEGLAAQSEKDDRRRQAELSKYLGGDEEHTHLVKGLDKALAEKVRREEVLANGKNKAKAETDYLDQLLEDAHTQRKQQQSSQAGEGNWRTAKPRTELGKSVLSYLLQKEQISAPSTVATVCNSSVRRSIQQSVFAFSLDSDVRKRKSAWEAPRISLKALATHHYAGEGITERILNPLSQHMIAAISKKLDDKTCRKGKSKHQSSYAKKNWEGIHGTVTSKDAADYKDEHYGRHKEDDIDDDIFDDAGSYIPQADKHSAAALATKSTELNGNNENSHYENNHLVLKKADTKQAKKLIFENLVQTEISATPKIQRCHLRPSQLPPMQENKKVIDRDIFGGQQINSAQLPYQVRRGPQSMIEGVSMTTYEGGYGEEMDVDFGNDDDEWQSLRAEKEKGGDGLVDANDS
ncbi:hypothetical protein ACHAXA_004009 [Cyclostephanos tholiformis]|uniref:RED-like N-terminal domain-containing protein n=1 Tax=Cyclostephanos tholiformis TaxID=382380 RepID=A0ABD3S048_9STRA